MLSGAVDGDFLLMQKLLPTVTLLFLFFSFFSLFVQFKHILEEEGGGCRGGGVDAPSSDGSCRGQRRRRSMIKNGVPREEGRLHPES